MGFLAEYSLFVVKFVSVIVFFFFILMILKSGRSKASKQGNIVAINLSDNYRSYTKVIDEVIFDKFSLKQKQKSEKKEEAKLSKQKSLAIKKELKNKSDLNKLRDNKMFVINFKGSIDAREVESLREEISAIISVAIPGDEVLLRLESGGGMVHGYGLAASQLDRLKKNKIKLTVSIDKVAASGGYMMACVGDQLISAPFAIIGSIGVIAQIPNFSKVLKKNDIDFEQMTAGEFKRTVTMFGENTPKAKEKFQEELEHTHKLFKDFVAYHRRDLDLEKVATGEHWFGVTAKDLGLVDSIQTSDDYIKDIVKHKEIIEIKFLKKKTISDKITKSGVNIIDDLLSKIVHRNTNHLL